MADFLLANHGSILTLTPLTQPARDWQAEHLSGPETQTWGRGTVIEPRYWAPIKEGIESDGLTVV